MVRRRTGADGSKGVVRTLSVLAAAAALAACAPKKAAEVKPGPDGAAATAEDPYAPRPYSTVRSPDWSRKAVLYQINTRQFTPEGTFRAAQKELPRLKALGVDILWIMPIHPIGEKNRKGTLGSPYSVKDYYGVNPELGAKEDFKAFVDAAHAQGFKVILDWVANHTAWDNALVTEHPDWYARDWKGAFRPTPWFDWSDIIDLDYKSRGLREYMTKAMLHWVRDMGVDGFRCDVAGFVPLDFWENVRRELETVKPVFMLAEWDQRDAHRAAFDASYAWGWNNAMHAIAKGEANTGALYGYYSGNEGAWPAQAMRMVYTSNHDQNAWDGTGTERFGKALDAAIVLSMTGEGIPSIYDGQEAGESKRLAFFEKDPIAWRDDPHRELFRSLIAFRKANPALDNGAWGARMVAAANTNAAEVFSFVREKDGNKVLVAINMSGKAQDVAFTETLVRGDYVEFGTGAKASIAEGSRVKLAPWGWRLYARGG